MSLTLGTIALIVILAWTGLFVVILAMCKTCARADEQELRARRRLRARQSAAPQRGLRLVSRF